MQNHLDSLSLLAGEKGTFQVPEREICFAHHTHHFILY